MAPPRARPGTIEEAVADHPAGTTIGVTLAIAQQLSSVLRSCCFNCCAGQSHLSVALLLRNNEAKDKSNFLSPAPRPPCSGDGSVVRAPDSRLKGRGFESLQERRENFLLQGRLSVLTLFRYPFHPRVTAVARKRSRSGCQKCRRQVTAKHAHTLRMWLCMK